jgi:hypothetical protein
MHQGAAIKRRPALVHYLSALAAPKSRYPRTFPPLPSHQHALTLSLAAKTPIRMNGHFRGKPFYLRYFMVKGRAEGAFPVKFRFCSFA